MADTQEELQQRISEKPETDAQYAALLYDLATLKLTQVGYMHGVFRESLAN